MRDGALGAPFLLRRGDPMRLERWSGIAVGLSAAWIVGSALALWATGFRVAGFLRNSAFEVCDYAIHHFGTSADCWRSMMRTADLLDGRLADIGVVALAPVLLGWLAVGAALGLRRRAISRRE